jgi:hypothetical protein
MVINGASRCARAWWANHLQDAKKNDRVTVIEFRGLMHENIDDALREMEAVSLGTRCKNYFYQANINPRADETLTSEQWQHAVDRLEKNLGFEGLPRFVVEHEKGGRTHRHVVFSRIDPDLMIARSDSLTARIHEQTSRELEIEFNLERGHSVLTADRGFIRPERGPEKWEIFRGQASAIDPKHVARQVRELYAQADTGQAFAAALDDAGYTLCRGDKRGFCILDHAGDVHSLARRVGVKAAEFKAFMRGVDLNALPSVDHARQQRRSLTDRGIDRERKEVTTDRRDNQESKARTAERWSSRRTVEKLRELEELQQQNGIAAQFEEKDMAWYDRAFHTFESLAAAPFAFIFGNDQSPEQYYRDPDKQSPDIHIHTNEVKVNEYQGAAPQQEAAPQPPTPELSPARQAEEIFYQLQEQRHAQVVEQVADANIAAGKEQSLYSIAQNPVQHYEQQETEQTTAEQGLAEEKRAWEEAYQHQLAQKREQGLSY